ncbi:Pyridoxamine 5'-phosphate oxidase [Marinomonas gallaica]|uniref:Pyridoxamine 5'-phosphate oxidase n=1 Tax=Marinomonas gallaica TaxID=1806667 RepID=A0A1C3JN71_9GAMM|nr:pyridoxamine 5'-phosphate oxidase family protein [Marinomonas gallaica]SBT16591.1 Pyridoxamine 5'-phosphate oxidase [Marinomonas gallaica]SBT20307.1 Pyridoxamine 5'-phosphate oxidase [Marinomonas gallaica]
MKLLDFAEKSVLCWLATVSADAAPNVSPKEIFTFIDENLVLIANIASPESERNIQVNPKVCVSFIDIFEQRGFKVKGTAQVVTTEDRDWSEYLAALKVLAGESYPIKNIFAVTVESSSKIMAPSYGLFPDTTTPESQVEGALDTYKVQRKV